MIELNDVILFITTLASALALTALIVRIIIPKLKSHKMGQKILDIGPRWHKSKEGTPTMGGIAFIFASVPIVALALCFSGISAVKRELMITLITFIMALLNGAIGFLDDYIKFFKKQNEGLRAYQKYLLQLIVCGAYLYAMYTAGLIDTSVYLPFIGTEIELGIAYWFFAVILITGIINSVNLTDGIDGLASSETAIVGAFFAVAAFSMNIASAKLLSAVLIGICIGFLVYNFYPAKIFMGDTGSLFLGGMVIGLAFCINEPLIVLLCGIMYVVESVSVILQVGCYKLTHKRIFKMSPIHHHFEKCGWSEIKIVGIFSAVTAIMCTVAYFGL